MTMIPEDRHTEADRRRGEKRRERKAIKENFSDYIDAVAKAAKIDSWNELVREVRTPPELLPALMTGRTELLALVKPRAYDAEEGAAMINLIRTLIETRMALMEHAEQLALMVNNWQANFKALESLGHRIDRFANFDHFGAQSPLDGGDDENE